MVILEVQDMSYLPLPERTATYFSCSNLIHQLPMDTFAITDSPRSCDVDSVQSKDVQNVSPRRLKKREVDRRCQREARERRRSRIARLESLVVDLRQQDAGGQVAALLRQLTRVEEERDLATKTLKEIQRLLVQTPLQQGTDLAQENGAVEVQRISDGTESGSDPAASTPEEHMPVLANVRLALPNSDTIPVDILEPASFSAMAPNGELNPYLARSSPGESHHSTSRLTGQALVKSNSTGSQHTTKTSSIYDWVNPQASCCCHAHLDRQPGQQALWQGNFWKFICDILSEHFDWTEDVQPADDAESDDVLIRALVEGWDTVAKRAPLHPSLQMLRRIDEATFRPIAKTERLAMLRAMHLLLQFHTQPCTERYKRLPPWYLYSPSQYTPHTYAIDYWAWPPFRQRFISNENTYCGNEFFYMYQSQLRLLWPFEFRDCYIHDLESGLYRPSVLFDERINDIKCWTMGYDFFQRFPELSSDIPVAVGQVPKPLPSGIRQMQKRSSSPASTSLNRGVQSTKFAVVDEGEPLRQEQEQHLYERTDAYGDASSQTVSTNGRLFQPHLTQSRNEQAYAFALPLHDYNFQQPAVDILSPLLTNGTMWEGFEYGTSFLEPTTSDTSTSSLTPHAAVAYGSTSSSGLRVCHNTFSIV